MYKDKSFDGAIDYLRYLVTSSSISDSMTNEQKRNILLAWQTLIELKYSPFLNDKN